MTNFVEYLNTLHRFSGKNDNATAEANYHTDFAVDLLVKDEKLIGSVMEELRQNHRVLLTGFAGDGKTTIARIIAGIDLNDPRTVITNWDDGRSLVIIKDLSELPEQSGDILWNDLNDKNIDLLIVSNTGTFRKRMMLLYERISAAFGNVGSESNLETTLLSGMENVGSNGHGSIRLGMTFSISVFNLVKHDNLEIAFRVFRKILDHPSWNNVTVNEKRSIPFVNRELMKANNYQALSRMEMIYKRIYEYGNRMTMRQLIEHFSYSLTGNRHLNNQFTGISFKELFFENFFSLKAARAGISGAKLVNDAKFGFNIDSEWKRRIWIGSNNDKLKIEFGNSWFSELFEHIRFRCSTNRYYYAERLSVVRAVFFLNTTFSETNESWKYICSFLNSPGFRYFAQINNGKNNALSRSDKNHISKKIRHVIKEYFIGMKIPETSGYASKKEIYIAMARNVNNLKQTAQIILASFEWKDLDVYSDIRGIKQLLLRTDCNNVDMIIPLPFLDYLLSCHSGFASDPAFVTYRKRLDNLRNNILKSRQETDESLMRLAYLDISREIHVVNYYKEDSTIFVEEGE